MTGDRLGPCERCGGRVVPIVYGLPSHELFEAAERGELVLGGCTPETAVARCVECGWQRHELDPLARQWLDRLNSDVAIASADAAHLIDAAERVAAVALLADALAGAVARHDPGPAYLTAGLRLAGEVHAAVAPALEAAAVGRRALVRIRTMLDAVADEGLIEGEGPHPNDVLAELAVEVSAARALAEGAAEAAWSPLRRLARVTAASAMGGGSWSDTALAAAAQVLRHPPLPAGPATLADERPTLHAVDLEQLAVEVAGLLANLTVDHRSLLVIGRTDESNRFVQAITYDQGLLVESVDDEFLAGDDRLDAADESWLARAGWTRAEPDGSPNWHRRYDDPLDVRAAADLLVRTLVEVHGVTSPAELALGVGATIDPYGPD